MGEHMADGRRTWSPGLPEGEEVTRSLAEGCVGCNRDFAGCPLCAVSTGSFSRSEPRETEAPRRRRDRWKLLQEPQEGKGSLGPLATGKMGRRWLWEDLKVKPMGVTDGLSVA